MAEEKAGKGDQTDGTGGKAQTATHLPDLATDQGFQIAIIRRAHDAGQGRQGLQTLLIWKFAQEILPRPIAIGRQGPVGADQKAIAPILRFKARPRPQEPRAKPRLLNQRLGQDRHRLVQASGRQRLNRPSAIPPPDAKLLTLAADLLARLGERGVGGRKQPRCRQSRTAGHPLRRAIGREDTALTAQDHDRAKAQHPPKDRLQPLQLPVSRQVEQSTLERQEAFELRVEHAV